MSETGKSNSMPSQEWAMERARIDASIYAQFGAAGSLKLYKAAPALLGALKWVLQEIMWGHDMKASAAVIEQAISQAERIGE